MPYPWPGQLLLSVADLREAAGLSRKAVYAMIERGDLRTVRLGKEYRIARAEMFRILGLRDPEDRLQAAPALPQISAGASAALARLQARA